MVGFVCVEQGVLGEEGFPRVVSFGVVEGGVGVDKDDVIFVVGTERGQEGRKIVEYLLSGVGRGDVLCVHDALLLCVRGVMDALFRGMVLADSVGADNINDA